MIATCRIALPPAFPTVPLLLFCALAQIVTTTATVAATARPSSTSNPPALPLLASYTYSAELSPAYSLFWSLDSPAAPSAISFAVSARTRGYVGLGIAEVGAMVGTDAMVGWVSSSSSRVFVSDRFIFNQSAQGIALDRQQDWKVVGGEERANQSTGDTWTTIHFTRLLDTGDCNDRVIKPNEVVQLVWSYGNSDELTYHSPTQRGGASLVLVPLPTSSSSSSSSSSPSHIPSPSLSPPEQPSSYLNLTASNYHVPTAYTSYRCTKFQSNISTPLQAISWQVIVNTNAPESLHHIEVYSCNKAAFDRTSSEPSFECAKVILCYRVVAVWAVGALPFSLPASAGIPFDAVTNQYLLMQIHYTNPTHRSDIIDSSGMSLGLTANLRPNNAGIFPAGPYSFNFLIGIPSRKPSWTQHSTCPSWCTSETLKQKSIFIFASALHQHTIGKQVKTVVVRNGAEVATLGRADYYDFNFQQMTAVSPTFELQPGDELQTTCVWDSTRRWHLTKGGTATYQEMCMNYLMYYPVSYARSFQFGCFDFCGNTLNVSNTLPIPLPLVHPRGTPGHRFVMCHGNILPANQTCTSKGFGRNERPAFLSGCAKESVCSSCFSSLSSSISAPAITADDPPQPPQSCSLTFPSSLRRPLSFTRCYQPASGAFKLVWNVSDGSSNDGNATLAMAFQVVASGWAAFGFSPDGGMLGSNAFIATRSYGRIKVKQYYTGDSFPAKPRPGGYLKADGLHASLSKGLLTVHATVSLPTAQLSSPVNIICAKGDVNWLSQPQMHALADAYSLQVAIKV